MKKETRFWVLIILLIILFIFLRLIVNTNDLSYTIKNKDNVFKIKEVYSENKHHIEIKILDKPYLFNLYNIKKDRKIINDIYYYKYDNYECLLPIINDEVVIDMLCYKDDILYDYYTISGENLKLDNFVKSIKIYDKNKFKNDISKEKSLKTIDFYTNNNISNKIAITTYKGIISNLEEIKIFENDVYKNEISAFINNYYIIADYDNHYEFQYFYVVNLDTNELFKIKSKETISLDSYIQGIVDNKVYLYDTDNENQYEINIENRSVKLVSSDTHIKYYKNNKWEKMSKVKLNDKIEFDYTSLDNIFEDYDNVIESNDYYYLFKKYKNNYKLYRVDKENIDIKKYIMTIPTTSIFYNNNYLYYVDDGKLYYYDDTVGVRILFNDSELLFNKTIKYYIH